MIEVIRETSFTELENQVRHIPMLEAAPNGEVIYPYLDADIGLVEVSYSDIKPTTLYVLRKNLEIQSSLSVQLDRIGFDPLELTGSLVLQNTSGETFGLLPPVVEETDIDGAYLVDGIHRNYRPRLLGRLSFTALFISGVDERCPSYAYPNDWHEIVEHNEVPSDPSHKKRYRDNPKSLYRNFGILKAGAPRS